MVEDGIVLGVAENNKKSTVAVAGMVGVAVNGIGDGSSSLVGVEVATGANSTEEIDMVPATNPMETKATTSALPSSRERCIKFSLYSFSCPPEFRQKSAITH